MKVIKATYSDGRTSYATFCDECMAEADGCIPIGMWSLSCGHNLCSTCTDYGIKYNKKPHVDKCPGWKLGAFPSEEDKKEVRLDLERRGLLPKVRLIS